MTNWLDFLRKSSRPNSLAFIVSPGGDQLAKAQIKVARAVRPAPALWATSLVDDQQAPDVRLSARCDVAVDVDVFLPERLGQALERLNPNRQRTSEGSAGNRVVCSLQSPPLLAAFAA